MITTAKEFLQQYHKAELRLRAIDDALYATRLKMEGCGKGASDSGPVQATYLSSKLEALMEQYQAQESALTVEAAAQRRTMDQVCRAISNVPDPVQKSLLEHRYLYNRGWKWIARQLHFGEYHVSHDLHDTALRSLIW